MLKLAGMLARLEVFKKQVDFVASATLFQKAATGENALKSAAALLTDIVFLTHEYASRAASLEARVLILENERDH